MIPAGPDNNTRWEMKDIFFVHCMAFLQHKFTCAGVRRELLVFSLQGWEVIEDSS
jgi:hypothetical protein